MRRLAMVLVVLGACSGPKPPKGAIFGLTVDVERSHTTVHINDLVADPGEALAGHAVTVDDHYPSWDAAAAVPYAVVASDGDTSLGSMTVMPGRCLQVCASMMPAAAAASTNKCTADNIRFEWQALEVGGDGSITFSCVRCEDENGTKILEDCPTP